MANYEDENHVVYYTLVPIILITLCVFVASYLIFIKYKDEVNVVNTKDQEIASRAIDSYAKYSEDFHLDSVIAKDCAMGELFPNNKERIDDGK